MVDTTDEWIRTRTGIERRHIAADGETTVDLAEHAARRALEAAGVAAEDVDFIAFGTTTPDLMFPNCGVLLQKRLGCLGVPAFSVETACAGFMYALSIADKYVRCGEAKRALVIGAETLSRITDWSDRSTAILFADGAGAVVLEPSATAGDSLDAPARGWPLQRHALLRQRRLARLRAEAGDPHGGQGSLQGRRDQARGGGG